MNSENTNLTDPWDIVSAVKKKAGREGISAMAKDIGFERSNVSFNIHKRRATPHVLQAIANWLDCGVHGVMPIDPTRPVTVEEGKG